MRCLLTILLLYVALQTEAQSFTWIAPRYDLEKVQINSTEKYGQLNDVAEDNEGYLWLSGSRGLYAFDGHSLVCYRNRSEQFPLKKDSSDQSLSILTIDRRSGILYAQEEFNNRILMFDPRKRNLLHVFHPRPEKKEQFCFPATVPGDGLYLLYSDNNSGSYTIEKHIDQDSSRHIYSGHFKPYNYYMFRHGAHNLWFYDDKQIVRIAPSGAVVKHYRLPDSTAALQSSYADEDNIFFLDHFGSCIYHWNALTDEIEPYLRLPFPLLHSDLVFVVVADQVLIGNRHTLLLIDKKEQTVQDLSFAYEEDGKTANSERAGLQKLMVGRDRTIYLIQHKAIYILKPRPPDKALFVQSANINPPSGGINYRALAEDRAGNLYAASYSGVFKKRAGTDLFQLLDFSPKVTVDIQAAYSLNYWQGYLLWSNAVIELRTGKLRFLGVNHYSPYTTQYLDNHTLWLYLSQEGLFVCYDLKKQQLTRLAGLKGEQNSITHQEVSDIKGSVDGCNLWLATQKSGLRLTTKSGQLLKIYSPRQLGLKDSLHASINALFVEGQDVWYACADGLGVLHTTTGTTALFTDEMISDEGLVENRIIYSILPDTAGNFYLGSNRGLIYFDRRARTFRHLVPDHPLAQVEFNRQSAFRSKDGHYYFGGVGGLYAFLPGDLSFQSLPVSARPVTLYNVSIFNSQRDVTRYTAGIAGGGILQLNPYDDNVAFCFSSPQFLYPIYYKYRIVGHSDFWRESPDGKISLYDLHPGRYILEVKAVVNMDSGSAHIYRLTILKSQVWYKRTMFIIIMAFFVVLGAIAVPRFWYRQRLRRQEKFAALRTKISSDLHDDVGSILTGLSMQSQVMARSARDQQKEQLNELSELSRDAMDRMRDIVWAIDNRKDKYENLVDRMRAFAERNLDKDKMTYEFLTKDIQGRKFIAPDKRQAVFLIFKEAITNILKHSNGTHVTISLAIKDHQLQLIVADNGSGQDWAVSDGSGLDNMRMRAERIGGTLLISKKVGFEVILRVR